MPFVSWKRQRRKLHGSWKVLPVSQNVPIARRLKFKLSCHSAVGLVAMRVSLTALWSKSSYQRSFGYENLVVCQVRLHDLLVSLRQNAERHFAVDCCSRKTARRIS